MSIKRMCLKPQHLHHGSRHIGLEMCADEHQTYVFETATFASWQSSHWLGDVC